MKNKGIRNKILQKLYKPYRSRIRVTEFINEMDEIEKALDDRQTRAGKNDKK